jgi:hypothetical protein
VGHDETGGPSTTAQASRATITVVTFDCPRCGTAVDAELYGPCGDCRADLRARFAGEARDDVEVDAYEPKMNVTPNAVATKD